MKMLSKQDVADRLGYSVRTVENLVRRGEFPSPILDREGRPMWEESTIDERLGGSFGRLVSLRELAVGLGVSQSTVRRMMANEEIPSPLRIGRQLRWRAADLREWLSGIKVS